MLRKFALSLLVVLWLLLIGACAPITPAPMETPAAVSLPSATVLIPTLAATAVSAFPISITDGWGRQITFDSTPARLVSLSPSNTEILFAVGAGDLVVGVTEYCDYPVEAQQLPRIGGFSADSISVETIISLKPDLVLADAAGQEPVIEALERADVKVIVAGAASLDDVYADIVMIGKASGHDAEAAAVVADMKERVAAVTKKIESVPQENRPTVFWEVWDEPLMTAGPGTFIGQMIEMAGGINIFADLKEDYPQVSVEEVVKRNPAFILGPDSHADKLTAEQLMTRPGWDQIDAVRNNRIFLIDGNISSRPGPRLVDALEIIAKILYPNLFE